jgi:hypothetical protein
MARSAGRSPTVGLVPQEALRDMCADERALDRTQLLLPRQRRRPFKYDFEVSAPLRRKKGPMVAYGTRSRLRLASSGQMKPSGSIRKQQLTHRGYPFPRIVLHDLNHALSEAMPALCKEHMT